MRHRGLWWLNGFLLGCLLFGGLPALRATTIQQEGLLITGVVGPLPGVARPDAGLEIQREFGHALLAIYQRQLGLSAGQLGQEESALLFALNNNANMGPMHAGSLSSLWSDATPITGFAVNRWSVPWRNATLQERDISVFGGHGVAFWAPDDTPASAPGYHVLAVHGLLVGMEAVALPGVAASPMRGGVPLCMDLSTGQVALC